MFRLALIGCEFADSAMNMEKCIAAFPTESLAYSGVKYGSECYCASYAPIVNSTACNISCVGKKRETCAGSNTLNVS